MKKCYGIFLLFLFFIAFKQAKAQQYLGISNSNFSGTHGLHMNPAMAADSRHVLYVNLAGSDFYAANSYATWRGPKSFLKFIIDNDPFEENIIDPQNSNKKSLLDSGFDVRGPSFMVRLSPTSAVGLTSRVRAAFQLNNVSRDIGEVIRTGLDNFDLQNVPFTDGTFSLNSNLYTEVGITFGSVLLQEGDHFLKAGITAKRVWGGYSWHFINQSLDYEITAQGNRESLIINNISGSYGFSRNVAIGDLFPWDFIFDNKDGSGWGADLGLIYEYRPDLEQYRKNINGLLMLDPKKNKYKFRAGLSLLDLGRIKYDGPGTESYNIDASNKILTDTDFNNLDEDPVEIINDVLDLNNPIGSFNSGLPTALAFNFDYQFHQRFYTTFTALQDLRSADAVAMHQNSLVAVTPRFETKWFEFSMPLSLQNRHRNFAVGAALRAGPLVIGSDNLGGLLDIGDVYGADFYAYLSVPIFKGQKRDKDGDGVSNRLDLCPDTPGLWDFRGCPDSDSDGIADKDDSCPEQPGSEEMNGCPDTDGDGIPDDQDPCPDQAGPSPDQGCPNDQDKDGIIDVNDSCPEEAGTVQNQGCPDKDSDGLIDSEDDCPDEAGPIEMKGCHDGDGDGLSNALDA
ncbi:MAG: DUF5723 family protein, partial [Cyclobacteriaceae bacterium]